MTRLMLFAALIYFEWTIFKRYDTILNLRKQFTKS